MVHADNAIKILSFNPPEEYGIRRKGTPRVYPGPSCPLYCRGYDVFFLLPEKAAFPGVGIEAAYGDSGLFQSEIFFKRLIRHLYRFEDLFLCNEFRDFFNRLVYRDEDYLQRFSPA